jgi:hypothetical protein
MIQSGAAKTVPRSLGPDSLPRGVGRCTRTILAFNPTDEAAYGRERWGVRQRRYSCLAGRGAKYRRARFGREFDEPIAQSNGHDVPMT